MIDDLITSHEPGFSLEQRFYTDPQIYALEVERIVTRNWIMAGHVSELAVPGDFKVIRVASESAIVVRGSDGQIKAFANVCRHRGSLVCLETQGNVRKFVCPYHGWMYDIDGNLVASRNMPADFDRTQHELNPVSVDTLHGLIFICFSDEPPSLGGAKRDLAGPMSMFGFENMKVAAYREYEIPANWKLSVENYQECYHCATAHPDYAKMHTLTIEARRREPLQARMRERMEACGMQHFEVNRNDSRARPGETGYGYWRSALFDGYKTGSRNGEPVAPLLGELTGYDCGASDIVVGPLSFLLAYSDHVVCYVFSPIELSSSRCDIYWLVRGDASEGDDYDVDELTWLWDVTTEADKTIIVNNWKGVQSRYYRPGRFSKMEQTESGYVEWILKELQRD